MGREVCWSPVGVKAYRDSGSATEEINNDLLP